MAGTTSSYVGRFGDTLRKLTALDASAGAFAPQAVGGADTAAPMGAFSAPAPQAPQAPAPAAMAPAAPGAGAFGGSAAPVPAMEQPAAVDESGAGAISQAPTSWKDFAKSLPKKAKAHIADQIEAKVGDIKAAYAHAAAKEGDAPRPHASRMHMAMYLAEIALRAAANRGTSASDGEALAKGTLQTQERRSALAMDEEERQRRAAETVRLEGRADAKDETVYSRKRTDEAADHTRDRGEHTADQAALFAQQEKLERIRAAAEAARAKGINTSVITDENNELKLVDKDTGEAIPVTEEVSTTKGSRGRGTTTTKARRPVKVKPKTDASGLDQDTVVRKIQEEAKRLSTDRGTQRALKQKGLTTPEQQNAAIMEIAKQNVMTAVQAATGDAGVVAPIAPSGNPFDEFDQK